MDIYVWIKDNLSWLNLLKDVGIFSIASFFIQRMINGSADRKLEKYKHELDIATRLHQSTLDSSLERFKGEIALHLTKQTSLHERHLKIIDKMYKKLVELDSAMRDMTATMKFVFEDFEKEDAKRIERSQNAFNEYVNYFLLNKLYFTEDVCILLEKIATDYRSANWDYFEPQRLSTFTGGKPSADGYKEAVRIARGASEKVATEIPKTLKLLEIEFKRLLGIH